MITNDRGQTQTDAIYASPYKGYETKEGSEIHAHNEFMSYVSHKRSAQIGENPAMDWE